MLKAVDLNPTFTTESLNPFAVVSLVGNEGGYKSAPDSRADLEACFMRAIKSYFAAVNKALDTDSFAKVIARVVALSMWSQGTDEEASVGCGAANMLSSSASGRPLEVFLGLLDIKNNQKHPNN